MVRSLDIYENAGMLGIPEAKSGLTLLEGQPCRLDSLETVRKSRLRWFGHMKERACWGRSYIRSKIRIEYIRGTAQVRQFGDSVRGLDEMVWKYEKVGRLGTSETKLEQPRLD